MSEYVILKGGGGSGHVIGAGIFNHYHWTGTTDNVPRTDGTGSGLEPPPPPKKRIANRAKFTIKQLMKKAGILKGKLWPEGGA